MTQNKSTERVGLYLVVFVIMMNTCDSNEKIRKLDEKFFPEIKIEQVEPNNLKTP